MKNSESSSSFKYEFQEIQPPSIILSKLNLDKNNEFPNIITKDITFNNNPINIIRNDQQNIKYIKKKKNRINSNKIHTKKNEINNNSRNTSTNIYNKKKLGDGFISSSATSGINSLLSNTQKNNIANNIEFIENNSNNNIENNNIENNNIENNNIENNNINNIYNIKTTNNKSTNILIKNIYSNDDYFSTNTKEGILHLKDFEIYKSNKISQIDIDNKNILEQNKNKNRDTKMPLSFAKSCDYINRIQKCKSTDLTFEEKIIARQFSAQLSLRSNNKNGRILNLMCLFNKNQNYADKIILRGTRNEKGGVVDFSTASPKKYYKKKRYLINLEAKNKNVYKYPKWKIISSAKIIQKWWKNVLITYFIHLNNIKKIQKNFRNYLVLKKSNNNNTEEKIIKKLIFNDNQKTGVILLKKILEVKIVNLFSFVLINLKNSIKVCYNNKNVSMNYIYIIHCIIDYIKDIKKKYIFTFLMNLKNIKFFNNNYLKPINTSNIYIKPKIDSLFKEDRINKTKELNFNYSSLIENNFKKITRYSEFEVSKIFNLFYKILLNSILDKIKKEANRRTIIKAFRDINKMKYPILFYSLIKIHKYSTIKYNVMNAYAILIQRHYRDFKDKKIKKKIIYYY